MKDTCMSKQVQGPVTGYLINPEEQTIERITLAGGDGHLETVQRLLECRTITLAPLDGVDGVYCDDEGLLHNDVRHFFGVRGRAEPIAGRGLVLGVDGEGYDASASVTLDALRARVCFLRPYMGGLWARRWADAQYMWEVNSFKGLLQTMEREAAS